MENENTKINVDSCGKQFFYIGNIKSEDDDFITFWDRKIGIIRLNKKNVISITPFNEGDF